MEPGDLCRLVTLCCNEENVAEAVVMEATLEVEVALPLA